MGGCMDGSLHCLTAAGAAAPVSPSGFLFTLCGLLLAQQLTSQPLTILSAAGRSHN